MAQNVVLMILAISAAVSPAQKTGTVRKFVQISDIHYEKGYVAGSDVRNRCVERALHPSEKADSSINRTSSKFGDFQCDSPLILIDSAISYMKKAVPEADFILWTGDCTSHFQGNIKDWDTVFGNLKMIGNKLRHFQGNGTETKLIPVLGNHDSSPADYYKDFKKDNAAERQYAGYLSKGGFEKDLGDQERKEFGKCGYYSMRMKNMYEGNITQTFLVLNTNLYYNNKEIVDNDDPCDQLSWLNKQLKISKRNERVFIVAHVLPGHFGLYPKVPIFNNENITRRFIEIVTDKDNAQKIVAHFYGHLHTSEFRIFLGSENDVRGIGFVAPSITPLNFAASGINPSFRVYDYNPVTREILNFKQYYLPLQQVIDEQKKEKVLSRRREFPGKKKEVVEDFLSGEDRDDAASSRRERNSKFMKNPSVSKRESVTKATTLQDDDVVTAQQREVRMSNKTTTVSVDGSEEAVPSNSKKVDSKEAKETDSVDTLVDKYWKEGFDARDDLRIKSLTKKQLYTSYLAMKHDRESEVFKLYLRDMVVLRQVRDCNKTCHTSIMCSMTNFLSDDFADCLQESGVSGVTTVSSPPSTTIITTDTATTTTVGTTSNPIVSVDESDVVTTPMGGMKSPAPQKPTIEVPKDPGRVDDASVQGHGASNIGKNIGIAIAVLSVTIAVILSLWVYRKIKRNRYRSQEFLLTDSVFKYDGYSQVDQP